VLVKVHDAARVDGTQLARLGLRTFAVRADVVHLLFPASEPIAAALRARVG
jgi:hypothetical protein